MEYRAETLNLNSKFKMQSSKFQFKIQNGFTLFELLLSISIMGILIGVIIFLIDPGFQFKKARDSQRKSDLRTIQSALELYRSDQGQYPSSLPACESALNAGSTIYLQRTPCDPKGGGELIYAYSPSGSPVYNQYSLKACLENSNDTQQDPTDTCTTGTLVSYTLYNP